MTGAALGQGLDLSSMIQRDECDRVVGPAPGSGNNQSLADLLEWP